MVNISTARAPAMPDTTEHDDQRPASPRAPALKMVGDHGQIIAYGWPREREELFQPLYDHAVEQFHEVEIKKSVAYAWAVSAHAAHHTDELAIRGLDS